MAEMGWTARVAAAAGIAAGTGAAQLGLGYGLGVVVWPVTDTADDSVWLGSLGWATWITASATVLGAVLASRLSGGPTRRPAVVPESPADGPEAVAPGTTFETRRSAGTNGSGRLSGPWRLALAASAAVGALAAVALIALPARAAVRGDTFSPQVIAAGYALLGVLLGLVVAYWAVVSRPVAANLITTGVWLWALAISAVVVDLTVHRSSATYLTSWQFAGGTGHLYGTIFWPSAVLTLAAAFVIGVGSVLPAARHGHYGIGAATSGAVGPLLVAAAFFALAPQLTGDLGPLESAYLIAPYAVLAGLAGSAVTVAAAQAVTARRATTIRVPRARRATPPRKPDRAPARASNPGATAPDPGEPSGSNATSVAAIPAADPATFPPVASEPKRKGFWGRRQPKVPTQATPVQATPAQAGETNSASVRPALRDESATPASPSVPNPGLPAATPPATERPARASGSTKPAKSASAAPKQPPAGEARPASPVTEPSASPTGTPSTRPTGAPSARPSGAPPARPAGPPPARPTGTPAARPTGTPSTRVAGAPSAKPGAGSSASPDGASAAPSAAPAPAPVKATRPAPAPASDRPEPTPVVEAPELTDPEIAEAARPRGRAKKAANPPADDQTPQSTITPPPANPTIAQINPKPPAD